MNRNELIDHLRAISDAENAAYACQQAIIALQKAMESGEIYYQAGLSFHYPEEPPAIPERPPYRSNGKAPFDEGHFSFSIVGAVVGVLVGIFIFGEIIPHGTENLYLIKLLIFGIIGSITPFLIKKVISKLSSNASAKKYEAETERIRDEYHNLLESYQKKKVRYDRRKNKWLHNQNIIKQQIDENIQTVIDEDTRLLKTIQSQIKQLYDMGIVYQRFQNMVAINTLLEYVEMGVCDSLEGPNGAYAIYLQDLRMENICGTINELKEAMTTALKQVTVNQERLIHEVREVDSSINDLNRSLSTQLREIQEQTHGVQTAILEKRKIDSENVQMLAKQINGVEHVLKDAAYNEYIQKRVESTNRYIRNNVKNPLFS